MKSYILIVFTCLLAFASCKEDQKVVKAQYPSVFADKNVPTFDDGLIISDKNTGGPQKNDVVVVLETDQSFDEIYQWHKDKFAADGWKLVKNIRSEQGDESEAIIMIHTKGKLKHGIIVKKTFQNKQEIKTTLTYID